MKVKPTLNILLALATAVAATGLAGPLPMPPSFTEQTDPETVLRAYPLGRLTKLAVFSHHGKAIRSLVLPNGKQGWVYEVGGKQARTYEQPTRSQQTVYERVPGRSVRTYTLEFDDKGVVIDVLYNEQGPHDGLTALQLQRRIHGEGAVKQ